MARLILIRRKRRERKRPARIAKFESLEMRNMPAALVDVGHHMVEPNTPGQTVSISVVNDDTKTSLVSGFDLRAQIVTDKEGPVFDGVRFAGSLWNTFPHIESGGPHPGDRALASGHVEFTPGFSTAADGTLVAFSIDTTGIPAGSYQFRLVGTRIGDSTFIGEDGSSISEEIVNGTLQVRSIWQNPDHTSDVNDDGFITPIDTLLVINRLNEEGSKELAMPASSSEPPPYVDTNGDGMITPLDVILTVNCINGHGCTSTPSPIAASVTPNLEPDGKTSVGSGGVGVPTGSGDPDDPEELPPDHEEEDCDVVSSEEGGTVVPDSNSPHCEVEVLAPELSPLDPADGYNDLAQEELETNPELIPVRLSEFARFIIGPLQQPGNPDATDEIFSQEVSEELVDLGLTDAIDALS